MQPVEHQQQGNALNSGREAQSLVVQRRAFIGSAIVSLMGCGGGGAENAPAPPPQALGSTPPTAPPAPAPVPPAPVLPPEPPAPVDPTPVPEAPAVSIDPRIVLKPVDLAKMVVFKGYHEFSRYERYRRLQVLSGDRATLMFQGFNFTTGGAQQTLAGRRYTLLMDGTEVAAVNVAPGTREAAFEFALGPVAAGWRRVEIGGLTNGETAPTWFVFVKKGAIGTQSVTPVVAGTYELANRGDGISAYALAPGVYKPTAVPLARRNYVPFSAVLPKRDINCTALVPLRAADLHRPSRTADNLLTSFDQQSYFWHTLVGRLPTTALLDGPRGVGTVSMATHIEIGKAAPDGVPRNNLYVVDPWRVSKVSEDGTVKTLVGYRHRGVNSYWEETPELELVGDWSAVPSERRGFHELWGMAWDERTLTINEAAARIPSENNERPHVAGPVMFLSDTQNDRIVKVEFSATSHTVPPKVTEFVVGIADPWDVVYNNGLIYVSERKAHRIAAYDARTGAFVRTVVSGAPLATVDQNRFVKLSASIPTVRGQPCVAPEGLYKLPNDPWLYFGSIAMAQVKRVHLGTGEVQVVCDFPADGNSTYAKIAVSDGTFGPRGTVFVWTWSNRQRGLPFVYLPEGFGWPYGAGTIREWAFFEQESGPGQWGQFFYGSAGAVGQGRMVCAGAGEGLLVLSMRQAGDVTASASVQRGEREYHNRRLHLLFGHRGYGFYGLPLPWGASADLDNYFLFHGHRRG
jgi:hypothetical protein